MGQHIEYGIVWDDRPAEVTWITRDADDSQHRDIFADESLARRAKKVQRTVTTTDWDDVPPTYAVGDRVIVMDPDVGEQQGTVREADAASVYIEGPHLRGDSRVMAWTIATYRLNKYVRPAEREASQ